MESGNSVARWMEGIKSGDDDAIGQFVDRFYDPIVRMVQHRLPAVARRAADEEDVALSALRSFVGRVRKGEFERVASRNDLWKVLVTISRRKAAKQIARATAQKRGGGKVRGESLFLASPDAAGFGLDQLAAGGMSHEERCELLECAEQILQFLQELEDPALSAIAVWKSHDMSDEEIARELNCSTKTVERKRKRLRDKAEKWATRTS